MKCDIIHFHNFDLHFSAQNEVGNLKPQTITSCEHVFRSPKNQCHLLDFICSNNINIFFNKIVWLKLFWILNRSFSKPIFHWFYHQDKTIKNGN